MEIFIWLSFIGVIALIGFIKFKNASKGKDCCK